MGNISAIALALARSAVADLGPEADRKSGRLRESVELLLSVLWSRVPPVMMDGIIAEMIQLPRTIWRMIGWQNMSADMGMGDCYWMQN
jgi:hypothetical protein